MGMTLIFIGVMLAMSAAQVPTKPPSGPCEDLDTASCAGFHKANPALCNDPLYSKGSCKRFCGNCPIECYSCPHAVLHPHDCNRTVTCGATMQCVSKHMRATDGHHEYHLMCETKEICDLFAYGFGKRDLLSAGERTERDIIINCCDTDRCNYDVHTTNAPVITTPKPTTQPSLECYSCSNTVLNPQDCNTTSTCSPDEQCVTRTLKTKDGRIEYWIGCELSELCGLLAGSLGKRNLEDIENIEGLDSSDRVRYKRDVLMRCCTGDLCNVETLTTPATLTTTSIPTTSVPTQQQTTTHRRTTHTTTAIRKSSTTHKQTIHNEMTHTQTTHRSTNSQTTTPSPTHASPSHVSSCYKDIVFVLRTIHLQTAHGLRERAYVWVPFLRDIVANITVGPGHALVAAVSFDNNAKLCGLLAGSLGKRNLEDIENIEGLDSSDRVRYKRDVLMRCCTGDLCNVETLTTPATLTTTSIPTTSVPTQQQTTTHRRTTHTTTAIRKSSTTHKQTIHNEMTHTQTTHRSTNSQTTTPSPTHASPSHVSSCYKDIVFVLRTIHLQTAHGLRERAYVWVPFLRDIVANITVGPGHALVAAVSFDNNAKVRWYLNDSSSKVDLYHELDRLWSSQPIADHDKSANIGDAFTLVTRNVLNVNRGDRPGADNVVVVLDHGDVTAGNSHVRSETAKLHALSKDVLLLDVKPRSDLLATGIATNSNGIFQVPDWQNLTQLVPQITSRICA